MTLRAGFIGLGNIGRPMASHLAPAGFDTTLFDDTSFRSQPPSLAEIDFAFFFLSEADTGATVYEVVGSVDSVVPEPGASLLLASVAVSGLVAGRRYR